MGRRVRRVACSRGRAGIGGSSGRSRSPRLLASIEVVAVIPGGLGRGLLEGGCDGAGADAGHDGSSRPVDEPVILRVPDVERLLLRTAEIVHIQMAFAELELAVQLFEQTLPVVEGIDGQPGRDWNLYRRRV